MNEKDENFLARWSKRKLSGKTAETIDDSKEIENLSEDESPANYDEIADENIDDEITDEELLAEYELTHPEEINDPEKLDDFFSRPVPDRLKQLAMRRMWRINPLFRFADEMVEYGEDYTDAATVVPDLKTAYQVGKGYFDKLFLEKNDDNEADDAGETEISAEDPEGQIFEEDENKDAGEAGESPKKEENKVQQEALEPIENSKKTDKNFEKDNGEKLEAIDDIAGENSDSDEIGKEKPLRARNMVFRKPSN